MSDAVRIISPAFGLTKALTQGNSSNIAFGLNPSGIQVQVLQPGQQIPGSGGNTDDGVIGAGVQLDGTPGIECAMRHCIMPYCTMGPGNVFSVRLWKWRLANSKATLAGAFPQTSVWVYSLIAELVCQSGTQAGVLGGYLSDREYLCDTVVLAQGTLGPTGYINAIPGSGIPAEVYCELSGAGLVQYDFAMVDTNGLLSTAGNTAVGGNAFEMNALLAPA